MPPTPCVANPRRAPRVPVRLRVEISQRGEAWRAETADIGPAGCLVVSPRRLVARAPLWLTVRSEIVPETLAVSGNVAWSDASRGGVEFVGRKAGASGDPATWFKKLLKALPQLAADVERTLDRVALDAALFVRPAPPELPRLSSDEIALLRRTENGLRVQALITRSEIAADRATRALFGLLSKRILTLAHGEAGEAWRWRALLARAASASPTVTATSPLPAIVRTAPLPPAARPAPSAPPQLARATPVPGASRAIPPPLPRSAGATQQRTARTPAPSPDPPPQAVALTPAPPSAPDAAPARLRPGPARPAKAQILLDEAREAARDGRIHDQAIPLLRRALALSPLDGEIAQLIGELAFKDRKVV